jgi:hypothetical protein
MFPTPSSDIAEATRHDLLQAESPPIVCDILAQGLIGLIEYPYQQVATSFSEAHLETCLAWSDG